VTASGPVLLGDLIRERKLLWAWCCDCCRERDIDPATIPLPSSTPVPEVGRHMRCSACESRNVSTKPEHMPGGVVASRQAKARSHH
jgi:hypothetical protein